MDPNNFFVEPGPVLYSEVQYRQYNTNTGAIQIICNFFQPYQTPELRRLCWGRTATRMGASHRLLQGRLLHQPCRK
jgi:hypothetical protein